MLWAVVDIEGRSNQDLAKFVGAWLCEQREKDAGRVSTNQLQVRCVGGRAPPVHLVTLHQDLIKHGDVGQQMGAVLTERAHGQMHASGTQLLHFPSQPDPRSLWVLYEHGDTARATTARDLFQ